MIVRIARKEMTEIFRDGRFIIAAAVVLILLLASLAAGWKQFTDIRTQHETAQRAERSNWLGQAPKNPHQGAHYGVYAFKPRSQLSMVDTGVDPYVGVSVYLEAHKQNESTFRPAQDGSTSIQRFGELTAAIVLQGLVPLLIVLLTFGAFSGEREQDTLRQVLSLGIAPRALAMGKSLGIAAALATVLVPAAVIGSLALTLSSSGGLFAADGARAIFLMLTYAVYFLMCIALSLAVSARASSSRLALVALLAFWMVNSVIAPRAISDIASWRHPTPSKVQFDTALQRDLGDTKELDAKLDRMKHALFDKYGVAALDALPINVRGISLQEAEEHGYQVFGRHYNDVFDRFEQQNTVYQWGGVIAPLIAVRSISMALAGTDFAHHRDFIDAAEEYRRTIIRFMNDDILAHPVQAGGEYLANRELWETVPAFQYEAPDVSWALRHCVVSLLVLAGWFAASVLAAGTGARRLTR